MRDPVLIHYMLVGMTSVLTSLRQEISLIAGMDVMALDMTDPYAQIIDRFLMTGGQTSHSSKNIVACG